MQLIALNQYSSGVDMVVVSKDPPQKWTWAGWCKFTDEYQSSGVLSSAKDFLKELEYSTFCCSYISKNVVITKKNDIVTLLQPEEKNQASLQKRKWPATYFTPI